MLDTNIFVSILIRPGQTFRALLAIVDRQATVLYSTESLTELVAVLRRPKFSPFTDADQIGELTKWIIGTGELVTVDRRVAQSRDAADDKFLSLAVSGNANYLITGDRDLLVLGRVGSTEIVSPAQFVSAIQQNET